MVGLPRDFLLRRLDMASGWTLMMSEISMPTAVTPHFLFDRERLGRLGACRNIQGG